MPSSPLRRSGRRAISDAPLDHVPDNAEISTHSGPPAALSATLRRPCTSTATPSASSCAPTLVFVRRCIPSARRTLDLAEVQLLKAIKSGDGSSIRFFLRTVGASRGYAERSSAAAPPPPRPLYDEAGDAPAFAGALTGRNAGTPDRSGRERGSSSRGARGHRLCDGLDETELRDPASSTQNKVFLFETLQLHLRRDALEVRLTTRKCVVCCVASASPHGRFPDLARLSAARCHDAALLPSLFISDRLVRGLPPASRAIARARGCPGARKRSCGGSVAPASRTAQRLGLWLRVSRAEARTFPPA